jgi:hypothetical protein
MLMVSILMAVLLVLGTATIIVVSFREKPSDRKSKILEETRIVFPVEASLKELETKVNRQVEQIQMMAGTMPVPPKPITLGPKLDGECRKPEHDTRMIRLVQEQTEEIQRLADESVRGM